MTLPGKQVATIRVPRLTLRTRLTVLYGALFSASVAAIVAVSELLWPNLLREHASQAAPVGAQTSPGPGYTGSGYLSSTGHSVSVQSVAFLVVLIALSLGVGWLVAGRNLRPLRAIIATSRDISARNLHQRLNLTGPHDEFTELGATLDDLFGRLEASFESQRRFVANASHELRTPLAAGRTLLQVALADPDADSQALRSACQQALVLGDQQERLIEALLTLASSERGVEQWEPFDLADIAAKVIEDRGQEAGGRGLAIAATLAPAPATGDPSLAESLVANLVDNALRYNVAGGRIDVSTSMTAGRASVRVTNTGPVIPADQLDRLFQPFQRLGRDRIGHDLIGHGGGRGLGLAIVRAIAHAHAAALTARPRPEGGLDIEVGFP
jgi:signal transduction histidine kinase